MLPRFNADSKVSDIVSYLSKLADDPQFQYDKELHRKVKFIAGQANIELDEKPIKHLEKFEYNFLEIYKDFDKQDKAIFLIAMLTKNIHLLSSVIPEKNEEHKIFIHSIKTIFEDSKQELINPRILTNLQKILKEENQHSLVFILGSAFQAIPETSPISSNKSFIGMPNKKDLLMLLLDKVDKPIKSSVLSLLGDISYHQALPAYRPSLDPKSYITSRITFKEYKLIAETKRGVDISEYIILTIGFLRSLDNKNEAFLAELANDYLFARYDTCVNKIKKYCEQKIFLSETQKDHPFFKQSPEMLAGFTRILELSKNLAAFDPNQNHTRRFFETRTSQYICGITHTEKTLDAHDNKDEKKSLSKSKKIIYDDTDMHNNTMRAVNKILMYFLGDSGVSQTLSQVENNIMICANRYRDEALFPPETMKATRDKSSAFKLLDRGKRPEEHRVKERKFEVDSGSVGESIWNSSGGAMNTYSQTFLDAQIIPPLRNMIVDAAQKSAKKQGAKQWGHQNDRQYAAYVGSISGHTCNTVTMLISYMKENKDDPLLSQDIHLYLIQFASAYVKRGFHSYLEVLDIFTDKNIKNIFADFGVDINFNTYLASLNKIGGQMIYGINDTVDYTKTLLLKQAALAELKDIERKPAKFS